jgi:acyl-CoA dehydrogenase
LTEADRGEPCGAEANLAKLLAADASWVSANAALQTFGGFDAEHILGLPRSF